MKYAFLNFKDHPRGNLMLEALIINGLNPTLVIEEDSKLAKKNKRANVPYLGEKNTDSFELSKMGIKQVIVSNINNKNVKEELAKADLDLIVLGDCRIIKPDIFTIPRVGTINVHPGYLPTVRGNTPYIWATVKNLPQGCTAHFIDQGIDTGPIISRKLLDPEEIISYEILIKLIGKLCTELIVDVLKDFRNQGKLVRSLQDELMNNDKSHYFKLASANVKELAIKMIANKQNKKAMNYSSIHESEVRSYCRKFPSIFTTAHQSIVKSGEKEYIDFLAGAGAMNYGHNNSFFKEKLLEYIKNNGISNALDLSTTAKENFIHKFRTFILEKRGLDYKIQFTGPTGTNTVEAAIKLAQIYTNRNNIIAFTNAYHGHTKGALRLTANSYFRAGLENDINNSTTFLPFDGYLGSDFSSAKYIEKILSDSGSGVDKPAAIILETIQGEGGINVASKKWLQQVYHIAKKHSVLLIVDDIQMGCGRTGKFFSFEEVGIYPDMVTLSKSLSGYGLPMSLLLIKPEVDVWKPGQHTGTFRGNNLAFVTATAAITKYWTDDKFERKISESSKLLFDTLFRIKGKYQKEKDYLFLNKH